MDNADDDLALLEAFARDLEDGRMQFASERDDGDRSAPPPGLVCSARLP